MTLNNYNESYTVAITCCDRDVHHLNWALDVLSFQTETFDHLIVSANGLPKNYFDDKPKKIRVRGKEIPIKYISVKDRKNPGFSRNYAARHCNTKYIMFCDIDDASYPTRLEVAKKCIKKYNLDIFCHGQHVALPNGHLYEVKKQNTWRNAGLAFTNFAKFSLLCSNNRTSQPFCLEIETLRFEEKDNRVKGALIGKNDSIYRYFKEAGVNVCYGQIVVDVNRFVNCKFREDIIIGEDFELLHRALSEKYNVRLYTESLLMHRLQNHSKASLKYNHDKNHGKWEIKDNFRKNYLQNRLDKNLNVYHNWDYENRKSDV